MKRTFCAKEPWRYVRIVRDVAFHPDDLFVITTNLVTAYKMAVDVEKEEYDSFIQEGTDEWIPRKVGQKLTSMRHFWSEVANGHLVEMGNNEDN